MYPPFTQLETRLHEAEERLAAREARRRSAAVRGASRRVRLPFPVRPFNGW